MAPGLVVWRCGGLSRAALRTYHHRQALCEFERDADPEEKESTGSLAPTDPQPDSAIDSAEVASDSKDEEPRDKVPVWCRYCREGIQIHRPHLHVHRHCSCSPAVPMA